MPTLRTSTSRAEPLIVLLFSAQGLCLAPPQLRPPASDRSARTPARIPAVAGAAAILPHLLQAVPVAAAAGLPPKQVDALDSETLRLQHELGSSARRAGSLSARAARFEAAATESAREARAWAEYARVAGPPRVQDGTLLNLT